MSIEALPLKPMATGDTAFHEMELSESLTPACQVPKGGKRYLCDSKSLQEREVTTTNDHNVSKAKLALLAGILLDQIGKTGSSLNDSLNVSRVKDFINNLPDNVTRAFNDSLTTAEPGKAWHETGNFRGPMVLLAYCVGIALVVLAGYCIKTRVIDKHCGSNEGQKPTEKELPKNKAEDQEQETSFIQRSDRGGPDVQVNPTEQEVLIEQCRYAQGSENHQNNDRSGNVAASELVAGKFAVTAVGSQSGLDLDEPCSSKQADERERRLEP